MRRASPARSFHRRNSFRRVGAVEALANPCRRVTRLLALAEAWSDGLPSTPPSAARMPRTARQLRRDEVDALVTAHQAGATVRKLAAQFGQHRSAIGRHLRARGINTQPPALTPEEVADAAKLYRDGWSLMKIAKRFGVNDGTVWRRLRAAGVMMRTQAVEPDQPALTTGKARSILARKTAPLFIIYRSILLAPYYRRAIEIHTTDRSSLHRIPEARIRNRILSIRLFNIARDRR